MILGLILGLQIIMILILRSQKDTLSHIRDLFYDKEKSTYMSLYLSESSDLNEVLKYWRGKVVHVKYHIE